MQARELIELSVNEQRTVTECPASQEEFDSLLDDLLAGSGGDVDTAEYSDRTEVWSEDGWRVDLIRPVGQ